MISKLLRLLFIILLLHSYLLTVERKSKFERVGGPVRHWEFDWSDTAIGNVPGAPKVLCEVNIKPRSPSPFTIQAERVVSSNIPYIEEEKDILKNINVVKSLKSKFV